MPWVTIDGNHVLIGEDTGGGAGRGGDQQHAVDAHAHMRLSLKAAVRIKGETFVGSNHVLAVDAASKKFGPKTWDLIEGDGGFVTNTGKYVTRSEAQKMVGASKRLNAENLNYLVMPKIKKGRG